MQHPGGELFLCFFSFTPLLSSFVMDLHCMIPSRWSYQTPCFILFVVYGVSIVLVCRRSSASGY
ncbi:uncharacterized protein BDZ83DRAFT_638988 [Colletotrichum acutatum]|uniref:Uncharacterized protein n=1 Tax=Glomerella acutata TaxID=27357 RepID=A0AAD8UCK7_GLOAC|nr:uncharacterized protein BDZ83DRAFT_638988 [Colletotrichum acutatum]KAK1711970.1 hypothetical protein BDZ83DRAFT_638988 [Colletotrichum acutatum]